MTPPRCLAFLAAAIACFAACSSDRRAPPAATPQGGRPKELAEISALSLPFQDLSMVSAFAIVTAPDAKRLYIGGGGDDPERRNLAVVTLDAAGSVSGIARFADGGPKLTDGARSGVDALVLDKPHRKLFLGSAVEQVAHDRAKALAVYDLGPDGDPVGAPRAYDAGTAKVWGLARHPTKSLLYIVGWGQAEVRVEELDASGEPAGPPRSFPVGAGGKETIAISPDGARLYLGGYPDTLEVVDLDSAGLPTGSARSFPAGDAKAYLEFEYSPQALYLSRPTAAGPRLGVWLLDAQGNPRGAPRVLDAVPARHVKLDADRDRLWLSADATAVDAITKETLVVGTRTAFLPLRAGVLSEERPTAYATAEWETEALLGLGLPDRPTLVTRGLKSVPWNRVSGYRLRATVTRAATVSGAEVPSPELALCAGSKVLHDFGHVAPGTPTEWLLLDDLLRNTSAPQYFFLVARSVSDLHVRLEIASPDGQTKTLDEAVRGDRVAFFLPGYAMASAADRVAATELFSAHAKGYLDLARTVGLAPADRPRKFVLSAYTLLGDEGSREQLGASAQALSLLGFNAAEVYDWGDIPPSEIDGVLRAEGIERRSLAVYAPPSLLPFDPKMSAAALEKWAAVLRAKAASEGQASPGDVAIFHLADEPGWYYPASLQALARTPDGSRAFRDYLLHLGLSPRDVGKRSWDDVVPSGASTAHDLPSRKLFYWTTRFFPHEASLALRDARDALDRAFGRPMTAAVNFNNGPSGFYIASPGKRIRNNATTDADSAFGSVDWFEAGRMKAVTPWTEDWFADDLAEQWSVLGDVLRSVAALSGEPFGAYVVGKSLGALRGGGRYKILALVGHGAKLLDVYAWGPNPVFQDGWSERPATYGAVADAFRMVGRGERLLYPGQPSRGKVALLIPGASMVWERDSSEKHYMQEWQWLHFALVHSGYTVDFVDETDLATGALATRGYAALYLTEPNLPQGALERVVDWVRNGGTVAVTPGAGVADEFDSPSSALDEVLGVNRRATPRTAAEKPPYPPPADSLADVDPSLDARPFALRGPLAPLATTTAKVLAKLASGGAAITSHPFGKGMGIAYGFFPGWQYATAADWTSHDHVLAGWNPEARHAAVLPARLARAPRPVAVDVEGVEACRLQSDRGIAVVLLNWTGAPIPSAKVAVADVGRFEHASSVERGALASRRVGDSVELALPLEDVDVLMLE